MSKASSKVLLDYTFVLDASGSMSADVPEVLSELNEQLLELKQKYEETSRPCRITIVKFDTEYEVLRQDEPIESVAYISENEYYSRGMTALFDAIGISLSRTQARIDYKVDRGEAEALLVVYTDGGENASKEFGGARLRQLIQEVQDKDGWSFALIGSDMSAIREMERMNMDRKMMMHHSPRQKRGSMASVVKSVSDFYTEKEEAFNVACEMPVNEIAEERERRTQVSKWSRFKRKDMK